MSLRSCLVEHLGLDVFNLTLKEVSTSDLYALSSVNHAIHIVAEPVLYSGFTWTWSPTKQHVVAAFLRTILERPDLARHVQAVALCSQSGADDVLYGRPRLTLLCYSLDTKLASVAMRHFQLPFAEQWDKALHNGEMDALITLLLSQLPNLETLMLDRHFTLHTDLSSKLFHAAIEIGGHPRTPKFLALKSIKYDFHSVLSSKVHKRDSENVTPFFSLPSVLSLSLALDNPDTRQWNLNLTQASTITHLDLAWIREKPLGRLLSLTSALRKLRWTWLHDDRSTEDYDTSLVDLDGLVTSLWPVRNTLPDLAIECYCVGNALDSPYLDIQGTMGRLKGFDCLKYLEIPLPFLATFEPTTAVAISDITPSSIERMVITDELWPHEAIVPWQDDSVEMDKWDCADIIRLVDVYLQNWTISQPRLKSVWIHVSQMPDHMESEAQQALVGLGRQHEVDVKAEYKCQ